MRLMEKIEGSAGVPREFLSSVRAAQLTMRAKLVPGMAATGLAVAAALAWSFAGRSHLIYLYSSFCAAACGYLVLFAIARAWLRQTDQTAVAQVYQLRFCTLQAIIGVSWAAILVTGMRIADFQQVGVLYALAVGLISTAVFSGPALYSLSFWIPVTLGSLISLLVSPNAASMTSFVGLITYSALTFFTITSLNAELIEREIQKLEAEQHFELVQLLMKDFEEEASDWLWETDQHLVLKRVSTRFAKVAGREATSMLVPFGDLLYSGFDATQHAEHIALIDSFIKRMKDLETFRDIRVPVRLMSEVRWWSATGKPFFDGANRFLGYRGVGSDITDSQRSHDEIAYFATHDSLTGLGNRKLFHEILNGSFDCGGQEPSALLCLDLDHFKSVNDSLGHAVGDTLLGVVAERIRGCIRASDHAFRLGGDEFAVILPQGDQELAVAVAGRIVERLKQPFNLSGTRVKIGACVGIAIVPTDGTSPNEIHHHADLALYRAKADGRGAFRVFDYETDVQAKLTRTTAFDLEQALEAGEFHLVYQPIVCMRNGTITAVEALVRWNHPVLGTICPAHFIPVAEQSGMILPLGARVIEMAFAFVKFLPRQVTLAINLSPMQLREKTLVSDLTKLLERNNVRADQIEFEITETTILEETSQTLDTLQQMESLGFRLSLDDFGTGYSSLSVLSYFNFKKIKIDKSFLENLESNGRKRSIINALIKLGRDIGVLITAEGVETKEQAQALAEMGCDEAQGFFYSAPMREIDFVGFKQKAFSIFS